MVRIGGGGGGRKTGKGDDYKRQGERDSSGRKSGSQRGGSQTLYVGGNASLQPLSTNSRNRGHPA